MKKAILIFLTVISFSFQSNYIQGDLGLLCSGKWHIEYVEVNEKKIPLIPGMKENSWMLYHADGSLEGSDQAGKLSTGKWEYLKESRFIKAVSDEVTLIQKIISISNSKLVISVNQNGVEMIMGFTKR